MNYSAPTHVNYTTKGFSCRLLQSILPAELGPCTDVRSAEVTFTFSCFHSMRVMKAISIMRD